MKRSYKNIIMVLIIALMIGSMVFTMSYAKSHTKVSTNDQQSMNGNAPPSMGGGPNNQEINNSSDSSSKNQEPPSGNEMGTPPDKPGESANDNQANNSSSKMEQPPSKPDNNSNDSNNQQNDMMQKPDNNQDVPNMNNINTSLSYIYYILFGLEGLIVSIIVMYLILSKFNEKSIKETFKNRDKIIINVLAIIILTAGITCVDAKITKDCFIDNNKVIDINKSSNNVNASGTREIDGKSETISDDVEASDSDQSAIVVKNKGEATIDGAAINKSSGDSSNTENSEFYGVNSGVLVTNNSTATIKNAKIMTNAKGSNAVFATGENAKITVSDTTIRTTGESSSRGLDATYGGTIEASNVTITTQGGSSATLATDRGEGTVTVKDSKLETNGSGSPVIYSTGNISIDNTKGVANGSQMVVIEGKNSATVTNSTLKASGKGNRGDVDQAGVMIYQSMSGDASEGTGTFTAKNSTLEVDSESDYYKSAPMFFITNTKAVINLEKTKLKYGSNTLLSIKGTSEWGNSNSNGGDTTLNATSQELKGNINVDSISTLTLNLTKSTYKGIINSDNSAKEINIKLDKNSKITLTGDSYVTSLEDDDTSYSNIDFNGYKLYVNGKAIN